MIALRFPLVLLMTGMLGLAGCAVRPPATMYQLDSGQPGLPKQSTGVAVELGPITIADYLQRDTMLQRQPDGSLTAARDAQWAGSLSADINQLLLRQLAWRLDSQRVVMAPGNVNFSPDVQVMVSITRLDSGDKQPAILDAQWRLIDRKGIVRDSRIVHLEERHQGSAADQARAQGILLQRLVQQMTVAIKPLANQPLAEEKKPARATKAVEVEKPKMPMATPIRTDLEIFRF